jgi:hypothetical protein
MMLLLLLLLLRMMTIKMAMMSIRAAVIVRLTCQPADERSPYQRQRCHHLL